jgi:hypothetical protein
LIFAFIGARPLLFFVSLYANHLLASVADRWGLCSRRVSIFFFRVIPCLSNVIFFFFFFEFYNFFFFFFFFVKSQLFFLKIIIIIFPAPTRTTMMAMRIHYQNGHGAERGWCLGHCRRRKGVDQTCSTDTVFPLWLNVFFFFFPHFTQRARHAVRAAAEKEGHFDARRARAHRRRSRHRFNPGDDAGAEVRWPLVAISKVAIF